MENRPRVRSGMTDAHYIITRLRDGEEHKTDMGTVNLKDVIIPVGEREYGECKRLGIGEIRIDEVVA